jgi:two-component system OmpR family sensor kinase
LAQERVELKPLIEDVCQQIKLLAPQRSITYQINPNVSIQGNGDALKQVLLVLLDNALKHTPSEAAITVTTAQNNGRVDIKISDTGPGIAPEHLPHIFDRFYRGDSARSGPGAGLGLAIAQELTQAQQGFITVESRPGRGSTFTLTFPTPAF